MTKYYRDAESLFDDTWLGRLFNDVMNHLITLWTGREYWKAPRPPLWARRSMLLLFPVSYVLLLVTIMVWAILMAHRVHSHHQCLWHHQLLSPPLE